MQRVKPGLLQREEKAIKHGLRGAATTRHVEMIRKAISCSRSGTDSKEEISIRSGAEHDGI